MFFVQYLCVSRMAKIMTTEQKLAAFEAHLMQKVEAERKAVSAEMQAQLASAVQAASQAALQQTQAHTAALHATLQQEANRQVGAATLEAKRLTAAHGAALSQKLFDGLAAQLRAFVETPAYQTWLAAHTAALPEGFTAEPAPDDGTTIPGGFLAYSPCRRRCIDTTLAGRLQQAQEHFAW